MTRRRTVGYGAVVGVTLWGLLLGFYVGSTIRAQRRLARHT